ncbi:MAG TPA: TrkA C-terminal domain-containing protein, partial [Thermoanaerobaculia bacterium]|nr:TrkA C-terminal domain-containing protein [Thermoanaerobaculia bacterium]
GKLLGAVSLHDIKNTLDHPEMLTAVVAHDLMVPVDRKIDKSERLHRATEYFATSDFERLPVVEDGDRFLGFLAKRDLLAVYAQEVLGRPALLATFVSSQASQPSRQYVEIPPDFALRLVPVPPDLAGKTLAEARLPQVIGARVIEIRRQGQKGEELVIPLGETVLEASDLLLLLGPTARLDALLAGTPPAGNEALATHQQQIG